MAVVDSPWDGSAGRFTDEQYERSCVLDRKVCGGEMADAPPKTRCSLPIKEPNGDLNKNAVHAAAGRIGSVKGACPSAINSAKAKLRSAYNTIGEPVPDHLKGASQSKSEEFEALVREFGAVKPGVARHGEFAMRELVDPDVQPLRLREDSLETGYIATLEGHFAVFNRWTKIDSLFEGRFMESIAPGAFKKTFSENVKGMRCMFQHGRDPQAGMNPIGPIRELEEDEFGARYVVPMLDNSFNRDRLPGLREGLYGASFRFQVLREEVNTDPGRSAYNPEGIEERVIREARVREFGPVTFPAYEEATAGVRSLNDWWVSEQQLDPELFVRLLNNLRSGERSAEEIREELEELGEEREAEQSAAPPVEGGEEHPIRPPAPRDERDVPALASRSDRRLPGAARKLRTSRGVEVPQWKL